MERIFDKTLNTLYFPLKKKKSDLHVMCLCGSPGSNYGNYAI